MGRQLYRVPLDFDWPLDTIWDGYLRNECGLSDTDEHCEAPCEGCREIEPPTGPGYQMWETTTEGSPQSPVFGTLDALCMWCEAYATTFADFRATKAQWREMLAADFVRHEDDRPDGSRVIFM